MSVNYYFNLNRHKGSHLKAPSSSFFMQEDESATYLWQESCR